MRLSRPSVVRTVGVISGAAWVWSWYTMYLEIHRWQHVTPSLRFNPGPPIPGTTIRPRPGRPLKVLFLCAAAAPVAFTAMVAAAILDARRRAGEHSRAHR